MDLTTAVLLGSDTHYVSAEHQRVAEIINDYNHELTLKFIPPEQREGLDDFPFAIFHTPMGKPAYIVRRVRTQDVNQNLIAWIFHHDQERPGNSAHNQVRAMEAANQALKLKTAIEIEEEKQAKIDFAHSVLNGKNYYKHAGRNYY
jgi:3-hydroxy-3-methylglutaryl CoA synthase